MTRVVLPFTMLFMIGSCSTDDPTQGGFFGGLMGLGSGSYERRIAVQQEAWSKEDAAYQQEVANKEALGRRLEERREAAIALDQDVATLQREITALNDEIAQLRTDQDRTDEQVARAEVTAATLLEDIERVRQEAAEADDQDHAAQAAELQADIGRLQDLMEHLARPEEPAKQGL